MFSFSLFVCFLSVCLNLKAALHKRVENAAVGCSEYI